MSEKEPNINNSENNPLLPVFKLESHIKVCTESLKEFTALYDRIVNIYNKNPVFIKIFIESDTKNKLKIIYDNILKIEKELETHKKELETIIGKMTKEN